MAADEDAKGRKAKGGRDPGDAVPPGVAVERPAPLTEQDQKAREKLERLGEKRPDQT